jgi:hypothetical protein
MHFECGSSGNLCCDGAGGASRNVNVVIAEAMVILAPALLLCGITDRQSHVVLVFWCAGSGNVSACGTREAVS